MIIGPVPVGIICMQLAKLYTPPSLVIVGLISDKNRLNVAKSLGRDVVVYKNHKSAVEEIKDKLHGEANLILDCAGARSATNLSFSVAKPNGEVTKIGRDAASYNYSLGTIIRKALHIQGSFSHTWETWERVFMLFSQNKISVDSIVKQYSLQDWEECFF